MVELVARQRRSLRWFFEITSAERILLSMAISAELVAFLFAKAFGRVVDWAPFLSGYLAALGFVGIGAYIRSRKGRPRLALALQGIGFFMAFTSACSVLIYTLLPLPHPMVDGFLTQTGLWVGYDWPAFVHTMTGYPAVSRALGHVYHSAIPQMLLTICLLAAYGRSIDLYRFLFVGMVTLIIAVAIWWRWPSVGYVVDLPYSPEVMAENGFRFKVNYGDILTRLLQEGPGRITPAVITGVVGFPSYHTVMALMVTWYCRRTIVFLPILLLNLAMIPATLLHGGHHAIDLLGGLIIFILGLQIANRAIKPEGLSLGPYETSQTSSSRA